MLSLARFYVKIVKNPKIALPWRSCIHTGRVGHRYLLSPRHAQPTVRRKPRQCNLLMNLIYRFATNRIPDQLRPRNLQSRRV